MRFSQLMIGLERDKSLDGNNKNNSLIRLLKDRNFGQSGVIPTKYIVDTGRFIQRSADEYDKNNPFVTPGTVATSEVPREEGEGRPW